jgi:predicted dehydrogenase
MTVRIGVIGAGAWGRNHVRTLMSLNDVELSVVCDVDAARRDAVARQYPGVHVTDSVGEALDRADAIVVATPAALHHTVARQAVERGLPVLVEKPFALSVADAEAVAELATQRDVPIVVGHLLVFHPALEMLAALVDRGELGDLFYLYSQRVNLGQVRPDENALWSFGPHDASVALELVKEVPTSVSAHGRSFLQPGIEDVVFMTMAFESGVIANVQMSWLDPHKVRRLTVVGSQKMVVFDDMQPREKLKVFDRGIDRPPEYASYGESLTIREGDIAVPLVPNVEPLRAELQHFADVVAGRATPRVGIEQGVTVVRVLAAATESMARGGEAVRIRSGGS